MVIAVLTVMSATGTVGFVLFQSNPALLVFLSARLPFLVFAAPKIGFGWFMTIGAVRLLVADPFYFRIGRRLGHEFHTDTKLVRFRPFVGLGLVGLVFLWPIGRHVMAAGAAGLRTRTIVIADVAGTLCYLALLFAVGSTLL